MPRVNVNPKTSSPTHTLTLSDGYETIGLRLEGDYKYIQETPQTPSTLSLVQQGGEFGDADPTMSHIQQSDWSGGRGNQRFSKDITRFSDSKYAWTLSDSVVHAIPQWHYAIGANQAQVGIQPAKNYQWKSTSGTHRTTEFTPSSNFDADEVYVWVRKVGNPNNLQIALYSSTGDLPDASISETMLITNREIGDEPTYHKLTLETPVSLVSGTKYFISTFGSASDTTANHWEIMTCEFPYDYAPLSYTSSDAVTWSANYYRLYFKISEAITSDDYKLFMYKDDMYAVQIKTSGTSKLYKLVSTPASFLWSSHTDLVATEVTSTGLGYVRDVCVVNNIAYFAQGADDNVRRWDGTTWADDGTNRADIISVIAEGVSGQNIYVSISNYVKSSPVKDWGTNLVYANVNDFKSEKVTGLNGYNNSLWMFTTNGIYYKAEKKDGTASNIVRFNANIDDAYNTTNGRATEILGQYLYVSIDKSIDQIYGTNMNDVGYHKGNGLPSDRMGFVTDMRAVFNKLFVAVDAGAGYSSIMVFDGVSWHELWRAPEAGKAINSIMWYSGKYVVNPLLVWDCGGDIVFMRFPALGFTPSKDDTMYYAPHSVVESSVIDMNMVSLPKMFRELSVIGKNLYNNRSDFTMPASNKNNANIVVKYHCDSDIGTNNYIEAGTIFDSPHGSVMVNKSNVYTFQYKMIMLTGNALTPPIVDATVVKCFARTPVKYQWVIRVSADSNQSTLTGAPDKKPDVILEWLKEKARSAEVLRLHASIIDLDGKDVIVEPPAVRREYVDTLQKSWGGVITVVLREA